MNNAEKLAINYKEARQKREAEDFVFSLDGLATFLTSRDFKLKKNSSMCQGKKTTLVFTNEKGTTLQVLTSHEEAKGIILEGVTNVL